ncbi:MAG: TM2 domain-containing protein [Oligoflexales bacterium]
MENSKTKYGYQAISQHYPNLLSTLEEGDPLLAQSLHGQAIPANRISDKSKTVALTLCFIFGLFGAHRFYAHRNVSAVFMVLSFGGMGIWWAFDCFLVVCGQLKDERGRYLLD